MSTLFCCEAFDRSSDTSNEWYTPSHYIEAARKVMGGIELDPASCATANQIVKAERYYTREQNGLAQDWACEDMWLNPPFTATPACPAPQPAWSQKLIREYETGQVKEAILLVKGDTKNPWFHRLFDYAVCISLHRIRFLRPGKETEELREGVVFVYFGQQISCFVEIFTEFGTVITPNGVHRKQVKAKASQPPLWSEGGVA